MSSGGKGTTLSSSSMLLYVNSNHKDYWGRGAQNGHLDFHTAPEFCVTKDQVQCCFTSTETIRTIRDGEPRTATSTFTQLLSSDIEQVQCCLTSTETVGTIRDGKPRTTTSTFSQPLSSGVDYNFFLYSFREMTCLQYKSVVYLVFNTQ